MPSTESAGQLPTPAPQGKERRRTPRLLVEGLVAAFLVAEKARMDVKDLSFGGFAAETEAVLTEHDVLEVSFLPPIGENIVLHARVAYAKRLSAPGQPTRFYGGFEFVHRNPTSRPAIGRLMTRVAALLGFGR
ncbi:MAG TPA: PilZ domain-containing protein [Vicinamibacterales bacterium]|nr:PilZ domain-containing protein [Vicinamibacterales bacterium]